MHRSILPGDMGKNVQSNFGGKFNKHARLVNACFDLHGSKRPVNCNITSRQDQKREN
jgi:hypothetical protein